MDNSSLAHSKWNCNKNPFNNFKWEFNTKNGKYDLLSKRVKI